LVFCNGSDDIKALAVEQLPILGGVKARMIERLPFKPPDGFTVSGPACEHQSGTRRSVNPKYWKHSLLILMI
jgi:hypothetical protein